KAFKRVSNVRLDLLRRHSVVKSCDHHYRDLYLREQIDRHSRNRRYTHDENRQAQHQNEERIFDRKTRHRTCRSNYSNVPLPSEAANTPGLGPTNSQVWYAPRLPMTTCSPWLSPARTCTRLEFSI